MKKREDEKRGITRREFHGLGAAALLAVSTPWLAKTASADSH